jgi:N-sulfoglucosamine sulfohydrolase
MKKLFRSIVCVFVFSLIASLNACATEESAQSLKGSQPNILFAIADDWGWPHAGSYGDPVVKTPAFDRVAREGLLFSHAYVSSPSCTPSRNAILTGQHHWRLGTGASLHSNLDSGFPVYPLLLEDAGYHVGSWRKSWGPGKLKGWKRFPSGKVYKGFKDFMSKLPEGKPFCFFLGASDAHRGYKLHSGKESGMDLSKIKMFECFPDSAKVRGDVADYYFEVQRFDRDVGAALKILEDMGQLDNTIVVVTGDHGMPFPRCKSNLYDSGARVPLAIRFGKNVKRPNSKIKDFVSLTDLAPTFLELAGVKVPEQMTGKSLLALLNNKNDSASRRFVLCGKERHVPVQEGHMGGYPCRSIRNHDYLYIRNFKPDRWPAGTPYYKKAAMPGSWLGDCDNGPTKTYIVNNKNKDAHHKKLWELSFGKRPLEELYDCRKDPEQLHNLAEDLKYVKVKNNLSKKLMAQLKALKDPRAFGEGDVFDRYPYTGGTPRHPNFRKTEKKSK